MAKIKDWAIVVLVAGAKLKGPKGFMDANPTVKEVKIKLSGSKINHPGFKLVAYAMTYDAVYEEILNEYHTILDEMRGYEKDQSIVAFTAFLFDLSTREGGRLQIGPNWGDTSISLKETKMDSRNVNKMLKKMKVI